jgi:tRNA(fMet)-specific endonuclease VapC
LAELWFGAERSDAARRANNLKLVDELAAKYQSLPFDNAATREYATVRAHLFAAGQPIGPNDMLIAAIARSSGAALVTHNVAEFRRVPALLIDDWQS